MIAPSADLRASESPTQMFGTIGDNEAAQTVRPRLIGA